MSIYWKRMFECDAKHELKCRVASRRVASRVQNLGESPQNGHDVHCTFYHVGRIISTWNGNPPLTFDECSIVTSLSRTSLRISSCVATMSISDISRLYSRYDELI